MAHPLPTRLRLALILIATIALLLAAWPAATFAHASPANAGSASGSGYLRTNLVSDIAGVAKNTDPNLVNSWGLVAAPTSPWWVADNGTGVSTLYNGNGRPFPPSSPLVVTIPPPPGSPAGTTAAPTGVVFNSTSGFVVSRQGKSGPSIFIFDTEDGTISGWNPNVNLTRAVLVVNNSPAAVYKGLAIASNGSSEFIYAANFRGATIDVFNEKFAHVKLSGSFTDPNLPAGYAPFDIRELGGKLYVTYAKQDAEKHDDVAGPGHGFLDVFDTNGHLLGRLVSRGQLNSPWGLALAPANFGKFSNDLLVGNFGDGHINAFDPKTGAFLGVLRDQRSRIIAIDGLWALAFGNGNVAGPTNTLFFTAGIGDEAHGLFGNLTAV